MAKKASTPAPASAEDRKKAMEQAVLQLEKKYGRNTLMRFGEQELEQEDAIHTGSMLLDEALGIGGLPRGRIVELYGPESSGKTTLALHIAAAWRTSIPSTLWIRITRGAWA